MASPECGEQDGGGADAPAVPGAPPLEGENEGYTLANGKLWCKELMKTAQSKGSGWVDYMYSEPGQSQPSQKWSYVKAMNIDGTPGLVGAGFYP